MKEWVVVACRAEAKIFQRESKQERLQWLQTIDNEKGRLKEGDFETDGLGSRKHTHAEIEAENFAHDLAGFLKHAYEEKQFSKACIFANPDFLGKLKSEIRSQIKNAEFVFVSKNLERATTEEIMEHIS